MEILYSIITGVLTGGFSILGIWLTLRQTRKQNEQDRLDKIQERKQTIIDNRPEFEIISHKTYFDETGYFEDNSFHLDVLMFFKNVNHEIYNHKEDFTRVEYEIRNIGNSLVEYVEFMSYSKNLALFNLASKTDNNIENTIFDTHNYVSYYGKKVRQNDTLKIRLWYHKDAIMENFISNLTGIGFKSFDKRYWVQNLNAPRALLEESVLKTELEYDKKVTGRY